MGKHIVVISICLRTFKLLKRNQILKRLNIKYDIRLESKISTKKEQNNIRGQPKFNGCPNFYCETLTHN